MDQESVRRHDTVQLRVRTATAQVKRRPVTDSAQEGRKRGEIHETRNITGRREDADKEKREKRDGRETK